MRGPGWDWVAFGLVGADGGCHLVSAFPECVFVYPDIIFYLQPLPWGGLTLA